MTDYIATRWYRAPEVLLSWKKYSTAIDVWSVGCILAEMLTRSPLFPGSEQEEQVQMIIDLLGYPTDDEIENVSSTENREFLSRLPRNTGRNFDQFFQGCNPDGIDLLKKMLTFDPSKRIKVEDALAHPYLSALHFPDDEPTTDVVSAFDFDFELFELSNEDYKDLIYEEAMLYHSDELLQEYVDNKIRYP